MFTIIVLYLIIKFTKNSTILTTPYSPESFYDFYKISKYLNKESDTFPVSFLDAVKITEKTSELKSLQNKISQNLNIYTIIGLIYDKQDTSQSLTDFSNDFLDLYFNETDINIRKNSLFALFKVIDGEFVVISGDNITSKIYTNEIKQKMEKSIENKNYTNAIENFLNGILESEQTKTNNGITTEAKIIFVVFGIVVFALLIIIISCIVMCVRTENVNKSIQNLLNKIEKYLNSISIDYANPCQLVKDTCILCLEKIVENENNEFNFSPKVNKEDEQNDIMKKNTMKLSNNQIKIHENINNNNMDNNPASDVRLEVKVIENQNENPSIISSNQKDFTNLAIINENKLNLPNDNNNINDINQNVNNNVNNNINIDNPLPVINNNIKCKHHFHKKCIEKWLNKYNVCPLCRERFELEWDGITIRRKVLNIMNDYYDFLKNYKFDIETQEIKYTKIIILQGNANNYNNDISHVEMNSCLSRCCMCGSLYCVMDFIVSKIFGLCIIIIELLRQCCR